MSDEFTISPAEFLGAKRHNVLVRIRNDEIEVDENKIRFNETVLPAQEITGIRFSKRTHCIEVKAGDSRAIKIECKRIFRSEDQASKDYQCIFAAIKSLLAAKVAHRIANQVHGGKTFDLHSSCKFTQKGLCITHAILVPQNYRKERHIGVEPHTAPPASQSFVVLYNDLEFRQETGWLEIGPKGDPKRVYVQVDKNNWNALIVEEITKHIIRLTEKMSLAEVEEDGRHFREHRPDLGKDGRSEIPSRREAVESNTSDTIEDYSVKLFKLALDGAEAIRKLSENRSVEQAKYGLDSEFFPVFNVFHNLFLHITDREAFLEFGHEGRNEIMKPLVLWSIDHAVNTLYDTLYEGLPREKLPGIKKDCLEHLNWSNETYGQCRKLFAGSGEPAEGTILWRFGIEVAEQAGRPGNAIFMAQSREQALSGVNALDAKSYVRQFVRGG